MKVTRKQMSVGYKPGTIGFEKTVVPYIRITNNLLTKYGFDYKDKICVEYRKNTLTITKLK